MNTAGRKRHARSGESRRPATCARDDEPGCSRPCGGLPISVGAWTAILSLIATILVAVVGFFGVNGINDMRRLTDETRRIEAIRAAMETTQRQVEATRDSIASSLGAASADLQELRLLADRTRVEQRAASDDFKAEVARSAMAAEEQHAAMQDALEETQAAIRHAAVQLEDLLSDCELLQEDLNRAREDIEDMGNL